MGKLRVLVWGLFEVQGDSEAASKFHVSLCFPWTRNNLEDEINYRGFPWSDEHCPRELSVNDEMFYICAVHSHMASATEEQNFFTFI